MKIRYADASGITGNLRVVPFNGEGDRCRAEDTEIVAVVGIFPDVLSGEDNVAPKRLLETDVEFIAPSRQERCDAIPAATE